MEAKSPWYDAVCSELLRGVPVTALISVITEYVVYDIAYNWIKSRPPLYVRLCADCLDHTCWPQSKHCHMCRSFPGYLIVPEGGQLKARAIREHDTVVDVSQDCVLSWSTSGNEISVAPDADHDYKVRYMKAWHPHSSVLTEINGKPTVTIESICSVGNALTCTVCVDTARQTAECVETTRMTTNSISLRAIGFASMGTAIHLALPFPDWTIAFDFPPRSFSSYVYTGDIIFASGDQCIRKTTEGHSFIHMRGMDTVRSLLRDRKVYMRITGQLNHKVFATVSSSFAAPTKALSLWCCCLWSLPVS
jgi:hypothetical protein